MSRRDKSRVRVILQPGRQPTFEERDAILRAADMMIARGGRALLCKVLRGSKSADVLKHDLQNCPSYGQLSEYSEEVVVGLIDQALRSGWLCLEYRDRLPFLVHSPTGWQRVKELWVDELLGRFESWHQKGTPQKVWPELEHTNREIKMMLLDRLACDHRADLIPILEFWQTVEVKKVRAAISHTIDKIRQQPLHEPTQEN